MVDLLAPELVSDPHPPLHALRERDPVHWSERHRAWILTRYADVMAGFRDTRLSNELPAEARDQPSGRILAHWMEFRDPPEHTRLRRLVSKSFTPRRVERLRPRIEALVAELVEGLAAERRTDFVASFAYPLPSIVIAELLGVPPGDRKDFQRWSEDIKGVVFGGPPGTGRRERAERGFRELERYFTELLEHYRRHPDDASLLSAMVAQEGRDERLSRDEIVGTAVLLLFGGHETTSNLLGNALVALGERPEVRDRLRREPALRPAAVEELMRFDGPSKLMVRHALEEREYGGRRIRPGERVFLHQAAANRDPEVFPDPDRLDLERENAGQHLGFGFGIHYCLGAPLARLEAAVAIGQLLERFSEIAVEAETLDWSPTLLSRGLRRLPVRLEPRAEAGRP